MDTYQQIHDFTPRGSKRFADFLATQARPNVNADMCRMECLGVMEDNLNGNNAVSLSWELGPLESLTGKPSTFTADLADLIVEVVRPTE